MYTAELNGRATRTFDRTGLRRDPLSVAVGFDDRHGLAITDRLDDFSESEGHHGCFHPDLDTLVE